MMEESKSSSSLKSSSSTSTPFLTDSEAYSKVELEKLKEFRSKVGDILETEIQKSDPYLIRWLRARNLDLAKAEEMLRKSIEWRREHQVDTILEREEFPQDLMSLTPIAFCGISKEGYAVFLCPFGRHDARYGLEKYGLEACERFQIINMEKMATLVQSEGKKRGRNVTQILEILDCEGYSYRQLSSKLCREFMVKMQLLMDNHYPETLRYAMIVNAPKIFSVLFTMMKPFIPKSTLEKIDIYGPEPEKWKPIIAQRFPLDKIPPHWGGTMEGVDEYCSGSDIWIQGPKDFRAFMHGLSEADSDFQKITVNARDKFIKTFELADQGTILEWRFKTENHDIAFQLTLDPSISSSICNNGSSNNNQNGSNGKCKNGQEASETAPIDIVPYARVDAQNSVQEGSHVCEKAGKYSFIFDNSFSFMKAKTLLYQIEVIDPDHQKYPDKFEDCPEI